MYSGTGKWLAAPWWSGIGVMATILVGLGVFALGFRIEQAQRLQGLANVEIEYVLVGQETLAAQEGTIDSSVAWSLSPGDPSAIKSKSLGKFGVSRRGLILAGLFDRDLNHKGDWVLLIAIRNAGPAATSVLVVDVVLGGLDVAPVKGGVKVVATGSAVTESELLGGISPFAERSCYDLAFWEITVGSLEAGRELFITERFNVQPNASARLEQVYDRHGALLRKPVAPELVREELTNVVGLVPSKDNDDLVRFVKVIDVHGANVRQSTKWDYLSRGDKALRGVVLGDTWCFEESRFSASAS